ncbi:hydrogenase nickel incorporation protein HypB [Candidatus Nitrotoga sp. 1052]|uniref:hydrogenase nickel incorporation protein HypB n=1 Tax=Candidatus Nitrotoga sp. 1052 TaxID=2886964 RepID=UPI001EF49598|nr:hydrogenase nickel incorporation protein HypB [Candidatus Nitrotoga sp. 1052]CAH1088214.1 hydrogenase isoenzymes nickel incorporation protein HypB [Candidatus Nitrotoga sp. 1052]
MCTTCGCGIGQTLIAGHALKQPRKPGEVMRYRVHEVGAALAHPHTHQHGVLDGVLNGVLDFGAGAAGTHAPGISQSRMIKIERDILAKNNDYAAENRDYFSTHGIFALNLVSSPGSGKTTLLVKTIAALHGALPIAVIEGDQQTDNDAARIRAAGAPAVQINTGKGCHLDAYMVGQAMQPLHLQDHSLLLIENVGNLVCPASFDLGEAHKVVILSVTEGEDKPLKYPDMFRAADLMLLNKCDLLPYLEFDAGLAVDYARRINPKLKVIRISASSGEGMTEWLDWIAVGCRNVAHRRTESPA